MVYETWVRVPSVDFVYASSNGRIRVGPYMSEMPNGGTRTYVGEPQYGMWDGSRFIILIRRKTFKVARLVCEAFHGEPLPDKPYCLHKDEDARNNTPDNLCWGTQKENLKAPGFLAYCKGRTGDASPYRKGRKSRGETRNITF